MEKKNKGGSKRTQTLTLNFLFKEKRKNLALKTRMFSYKSRFQLILKVRCPPPDSFYRWERGKSLLEFKSKCVTTVLTNLLPAPEI